MLFSLSPTMRRRVQYRQYTAHLSVTSKKHPVRIPVDEVGNRRIFIFRAGIQKVGGGEMKFIQGGNGLTADGAIGVMPVHQFGKIGRDGRGQSSFGDLDGLDLFLTQIED